MKITELLREDINEKFYKELRNVELGKEPVFKLYHSKAIGKYFNYLINEEAKNLSFIGEPSLTGLHNFTSIVIPGLAKINFEYSPVITGYFLTKLDKDAS